MLSLYRSLKAIVGNCALVGFFRRRVPYLGLAVLNPLHKGYVTLILRLISSRLPCRNLSRQRQLVDEMPSSQPCLADTYALSRDYTATSRLNYQYYLWKETLGYDLHPSISLADTGSARAIADVGCGTAIWLRSIAQALPNDIFDGLDISLAQCPPVQWLPPNVSLRAWDLFSEPPQELRCRYDVVHARLLFVVVQNEDPRPVINNLKLLLKPGGYLQWDELNVPGSSILRTSHDVQVPEMESRLASLKQIGGWVKRLGSYMVECGFSEEGCWEYGEKKELAQAFFDNHLAKDVEMIVTRTQPVADRDAQLNAIKDLYDESRKGAVLCTPKVVCVARKMV